MILMSKVDELRSIDNYCVVVKRFSDFCREDVSNFKLLEGISDVLSLSHQVLKFVKSMAAVYISNNRLVVYMLCGLVSYMGLSFTQSKTSRT